MKKILFVIVSILFATQAQSQELQFNKKGKFKIVQFTDLHIRLNDQRSDIAFERMSEVMDAEKPDLVVLTGDMIYNQPADENIRKLLSIFEKRNQPFAVTFGNHDQEQGLTNKELMSIVETFKFNRTKSEPLISGVGNCALKIKSSDMDSTAAVLYLFDSGRDSKIENVKGYAHIEFDQIAWYRKTSAALTAQNNGKPLTALSFFHIPLPEFGYALADNNASMYGIRRENTCPPLLNSGLFASFKEMGDVMGVFVGHDHDNDFAVSWHGILLAYGRFTGGPTEYNNIPNGARVIELTQGEKGFESWVRIANSTEQRTLFPKNYVK